MRAWGLEGEAQKVGHHKRKDVRSPREKNWRGATLGEKEERTREKKEERFVPWEEERSVRRVEVGREEEGRHPGRRRRALPGMAGEALGGRRREPGGGGGVPGCRNSWHVLCRSPSTVCR